MLTPALEKLILCGKASFNTFTIGGSEKSILNVAKGTFIIITDINIQHHLDNRTILISDANFDTFMKEKMLTQLCVFSDRSFNHFVIRNEFNFVRNDANGNFHVLPAGQTKLDTYLIHNSDVAFNWILSASNLPAFGVTPAESVGRPIPFDYGADGQRFQNIVLNNTLNILTPWIINQGGTATQTNATSTNQLQFPVDADTTPDNFNNSFGYPIANINYIEIYEEINNISATL
jgi:hypothetical protein